MANYRFACQVCDRERDVNLPFGKAPKVGEDRIGFSADLVGDQGITCECGANCWQRVWGRNSTFRLNFRRVGIG